MFVFCIEGTADNERKVSHFFSSSIMQIQQVDNVKTLLLQEEVISDKSLKIRNLPLTTKPLK